MSDEPKKPGRLWLNWGSALVVAAAAYQGTHYATAAVVHEPGFCCASCRHTIGGKTVPEWGEVFFWPAHAIDDLIGVDPWSWNRRRVPDPHW
jgi:hypothetical protein